MNPRAFLQLPCGRIATGTVAFALAAAGVIALVGPGWEAGLAAIAAVVFVCIPAFIFAVGLAVERAPWEAFAMLLLAPVLGAFYFASFTLLARGAPTTGAVLIALALAPGWLAAAGYRRLAAG